MRNRKYTIASWTDLAQFLSAIGEHSSPIGYAEIEKLGANLIRVRIQADMIPDSGKIEDGSKITDEDIPF